MDMFNNNRQGNENAEKKSLCKELSEIADRFSHNLGTLISNPTRENLGVSKDDFNDFVRAFGLIPGEVASQVSSQFQQISVQFNQLIGYIDSMPALFVQLGSTIVGMMQAALATVVSICKDR